MLGGGFVKLYVLLYIFFFLTTEKIGIYILTTGMLLSKTPSQKHDKHRANTEQVTIVTQGHRSACASLSDV